MAKTSETTNSTETVVLAKPHTHQGKACKPGDKLTVSSVTASWLRAQGVVNPAASAAASA